MGGLRRFGAAAVALTLLGGMTACGDDGGGDDEASGSASGTEEEETTTTEGDTGDGATDLEGSLFSGECEEYYEAFASANAGIAAAFTGETGDIEEASEFFAEAVDNAPDEIQDDLEVFAESYTDFVQALADLDIDFSDPSSFQDAEVLAEFEALSEEFTSPEFIEASEAIQAYAVENCDVAAN